ncbi:MAG: hypothetical protein P4L48_18200 [Mycobacterium sp.]|nr:hypothetical protein [Mycobacterium sp.]
MSEQHTEDNVDDCDVPVSKERLERCLQDAQYWSLALPKYADSSQRKADWWSILAGALAAITSLSIFPVVGQNATTTIKVIVSAVALASAIAALVPRVKNYGEQAGTARVLAAQYGSVYGRLLDLAESSRINEHVARTVMAEFQSIKEKKDALRGLAKHERPRESHPTRRQGVS